MDKSKKTVADTILFSDFCDLLDDIKTSTKQVDKHIKMSKFIEDYRNKAIQLKQPDATIETSFYPVLRLLLSNYDRERGPYGLKEHAFAKCIINILALPSKGQDANLLYKFRSTTATYNFADVACSVLQKHLSGSKHLSISDINARLDVIAQRNSENNIRGQEDEIFQLFKSTSAKEQKWLIRIILKEMDLGMGHIKILRLYHPDAVALFDSNTSLLKICEVLHDPSVRSNEIEISLFTPFRPMLSQRCDAKEFLKTVTENKVFFVETKFDGERFQMHMKDGKFEYFSRNGFKYTQNYGCDYSSGIFTPMLKNVFKPSVRSVILDGEMMGWNTKTKTLGSKGMNFDVKKLSDTSVHQPCFHVFDVIFFNDRVLTNRPLKERLQILETILSPIEGVIDVSRKGEVKTRQEMLNALNESMDKKEEGIVFKNPESSYIPNDRKSGWWKMKLEYFSNVMSDMDLIVMGGSYGRTNRVSEFILGVAVPSKSGDPKKFLSFARVGTGLNNEELDSIDKKLGQFWKKMVNDQSEEYGVSFGREKPDVWIQPEKSCVFHVRGTEITRLHDSNPDFKAKYTLRFPRIQEIRFDKPYYDCLTLVELDELAAGTKSVEKLYNRHLELSDIEKECRKLRKRQAKFQVEETGEIEISNDILRGYKFYVLSGTEQFKRTDVEKTIQENGGAIVKTEGKDTYCILLGDAHPRTQYYKDQRKFDEYEPEHMIYTTQATKNRFMAQYDRYGDSYTKKATRESLNFAFDNILKEGDYINPMSMEIDAFHEDINFPFQFGLFRDVVAYFDRHKVINETDSAKIYISVLEEAEFKFWGGTVSEYLTKDVDLVVIQSENELRVEVIARYLSDIHNKTAKIVTRDYICENVLKYKNS